MKSKLFFLLLFQVSLTHCFAQQLALPAEISRIAFGSCNSQDKDQPMWAVMQKDNPELFIFLGDNIYGDTENMAELQLKYRKLGDKPGYNDFKKKVPIVATWDDHDYGVNDGGKEYPKKVESKKIFLDFFNEPENSERRKHEGIYTSYTIGEAGKRIQIIMLDCRTFRDSICRIGEDESCIGEYGKCSDTNKTMLGKAQWIWLEQELKKPADLRMIASSTQFLVDFNGWEAWVNMPHERQHFLNLIKKTKANGVFFISGDLHYAELSMLKEKDAYPIYDLTTSGLTHGHNCAGPNINRIYGAFMDANYGLITINWMKKEFTFYIKDEKGEEKISHTIPFSELKF